MIISIDAEKVFDKFNSIHKLKKIGIQCMFLNFMKNICENTITNATGKGERLTAFPLRLGTRQVYCTCHYFTNRVENVR